VIRVIEAALTSARDGVAVEPAPLRI